MEFFLARRTLSSFPSFFLQEIQVVNPRRTAYKPWKLPKNHLRDMLLQGIYISKFHEINSLWSQHLHHCTDGMEFGVKLKFNPNGATSRTRGSKKLKIDPVI